MSKAVRIVSGVRGTMVSSKWQMASGKPHQRLELWQQAMLLLKEIYAVTTGFPTPPSLPATRHLLTAIHQRHYRV